VLAGRLVQEIVGCDQFVTASKGLSLCRLFNETSKIEGHGSPIECLSADSWQNPAMDFVRMREQVLSTSASTIVALATHQETDNGYRYG